MKNKKAIYLLLPVVVIIWVLIIYRLIDYRSGDNTLMYQNTQSDQLRNPGLVPDTFRLFLNYQDPFLKKSSHSSASKSLLEKPKLKLQESLQWPDIQYFGLVKSRINGEVAVNIEIDDISYIVNERSDCKGIRLRKITPDSVILYWSGEQKTIYRN